MTAIAVVDLEDLRVVVAEIGRSSRPGPEVIAATNRLRAAIAPALFGPVLSDPSADVEGAHHGRDTEQAAAWRNRPRSGTQRERVLVAIALAGAHGRTDEELEIDLNMRRPSPGNRRGELMAGGWVRDSGERRDTTSGNPSKVWVLTEEGRSALLNEAGSL